jgi:hypothetical protein
MHDKDGVHGRAFRNAWVMTLQRVGWTPDSNSSMGR